MRVLYLQCALPLFTPGTLQGIPASQKQKISYKTYLYNGEILNLLGPPLKQQRFTVILAQFYIQFVKFSFEISSYRTDCLNYKEQFRWDIAYFVSSACYFFPIVTRIGMGQQLLFRIRYFKFHWNASAERRFFFTDREDEANSRFLQLLC
jgi:hypothetical protein